jgi:NADPH:quinone reductase-like Zn-dependent oxidoreductase
MKAIVYERYGPPEVLHLKDVAKPVPKENEVLIRMHAVAVTAGDANMRGFTFVPRGFGPVPRLMFGFTKPRKQILGLNMAGEVEAVGKSVTLFKKEDQVFGSTGSVLGAYAEYVCLPEDGVFVLKPVETSYEEASTYAFGAQTALYFLRDLGKITKGQRVLISGASGSVGSFAVQLAKRFGAQVTAVCSTSSIDLVRSLGADAVIDYTHEDFTKNGEKYDAILDVTGKVPFPKLKGSLTKSGVYLAVQAGVPDFARALWTLMRGGRKIKAGVAMANKKDLLFFKDLIEAGKVKAVIDTVYPLEKAVEAHRHVDSGHKKGNVVMRIVPPGRG